MPIGVGVYTCFIERRGCDWARFTVQTSTRRPSYTYLFASLKPRICRGSVRYLRLDLSLRRHAYRCAGWRTAGRRRRRRVDATSDRQTAGGQCSPCTRGAKRPRRRHWLSYSLGHLLTRRTSDETGTRKFVAIFWPQPSNPPAIVAFNAPRRRTTARGHRGGTLLGCLSYSLLLLLTFMPSRKLFFLQNCCSCCSAEALLPNYLCSSISDK